MKPTLLKRFAIAVAIVFVLGPPEGGHYVRGGGHYVRVVSGSSRTVFAQQEEPGSPRASAPLTILQINDVYSTIPVDGAGGLARVATLKQNLAAAGLDIATLGNHEFDFGPDVLLQRMAEGKWQWLVSNVVDANGRPLGNAVPYLVKTFGSLKVGFIGLVLTSDEINRVNLGTLRLIDPVEAAATYIPMLKRERADMIVAVTHLAFADDRRLIERFPEIDLIVGGHEHYPIASTENRTLISKAGSEARYVARIDVNRRSDDPAPTIERFYELIPITSALADEPRTAAVVASYESRLGAELGKVVATSRVPLDADTIRLRANETNLGNLVADAMRADAAADAAIINSGSIRGDRVYQPGPLTRRTLLEMHPFGNVICKVAAPGRVLLEALESGVSKLPATAGQFPQVSGLTMRVEVNAAAGNRVRDVSVGGQPLDREKIYTVAITDYQLSGGDGYTMFKAQRILIAPESGDLMVNALEKFVAARGEVAPAVEGRITVVR